MHILHLAGIRILIVLHAPTWQNWYKYNRKELSSLFQQKQMGKWPPDYLKGQRFWTSLNDKKKKIKWLAGMHIQIFQESACRI